VCLNQFHDILPGSSIGAVYVDSTRQYQWVQEQAAQVRDRALDYLSQRLPASAEVVVVNPTSFAGRHIAFLSEAIPGTLADPESGVPILSQVVVGGTLLEIPFIDAYSLRTLSTTQQSALAPVGMLEAQEQGGRFILENDLLRLEFAPSGNLARLYDKDAARDVLPEGAEGNVLAAFEDRPLNFDAWDIDIFYTDKQWSVDPAHMIHLIELGPIRVGLQIERRVRSSTIRQRVYLYRDSRRVDFDTWVDWHEQHLLLKVAFPVSVLSPTATYEIQWGSIERPTHQNTSWDWARFENCGYKWVDLSEGDYGVSLLNDCKYGHDIHDNVMRLTLLKGATSPDPNADQGEHRFTYSLLPHQGSWRTQTTAAAYDLNNPLISRRITASGTGTLDAHALISIDQPNVIIETVKQAEDGNGVVVRLYESQRIRGAVSLRTGFPIQRAYVCNLLEENERELEVGDDSLTLYITPFQIVSLRIIPA
jgi:alpha-mannosidase